MSVINPSVFQALTVKHGLKLYADTGIKPGRNWTPKNMLATAGKITGMQFKRGEYVRAIEALDRWIQLEGGA